jgi:two-component system response regulator RegA
VKGRLVLVVDDEEVVRNALARSLRKRGVRVATAEDGPGALEMARREPPDLAIVDYILGEESGIDLIEPLHEIREDMRIAILSGRHETPVIVRAVKKGAIHYSTKPARIDELLALVTYEERAKLDGREKLPTRKDADRMHILRTLAACEWNVSEAARVLGIDRKQVQRLIDRYDLTAHRPARK